jgi:hypothetical protein
MAIVPTYSTGTVSVAHGATVVAAASGSPVWTINAFASDPLVIDGFGPVEIMGVTDDGHLTIEKWPYTSVVGSTYKILQIGTLRFAPAAMAVSVNRLVSALDADGFYIFVKSTATAPDTSKGDDGQFARQPSTKKEWLKTAGVWVYQGIYATSTTGPDGTAAAPQFSFAVDTDTGMYRVGDNILGLSAGAASVLQLDGSTASSATGLKIKSAAVAAGLALSVLSSGASEALTIDAKGTGTITIGSVSTGVIALARNTGVTGTLSASSDFAIATNKFTVAGASGNTAVAGTLAVAGVSALAGNVTIGAGGAAGVQAVILLNGGSGAAGGGEIIFQNNNVTSWVIAPDSVIQGSGTSKNLDIFAAGVGNAAQFNVSSLALSLYSTTASTTTSTGAVIIGNGTLGGLGVGGDINWTGAGLTSYAPATPVSTGGAFTTVSASMGFKKFGKLTFVEGVLTITTLGSATGFARIALPVTPLASIVFVLGAFNGSTQSTVSATVNFVSSNEMAIGLTGAANGQSIYYSGIYYSA